MTTLKNFDAQYFLKHFWQQKPVVIKNAFEQAAWIEADELAGLACEEQAESRIIHQNQGQWLVDHGPFKESFFSTLAEEGWTLLVQAVDQWVPEVKAVLDAFDFLPSWRLDDVMVSYAPVGGSVAPHFDYYDVFLIQGEGKRRWQVGQTCNERSACESGSAIKTVKDFRPEMDVILTSGDLLYVPAKHSHYGISVENSLTYSVGFRAPSVRDIVDGIATEALSYLHEDQRYVDTITSLKAPAAEIPKAAIEQITSMLAKSLIDNAYIVDWIGKYVTEPKYSESTSAELDFFDSQSTDITVNKDPVSRIAYHVINPDLDVCHLFINGERYDCSVELAKYLCSSNTLEVSKLLLFDQPKDKDLLQLLFEAQGWPAEF
jgi:50S ribosomal protein L16 3-hydroxylase